jgi:hypothetical protein
MIADLNDEKLVHAIHLEGKKVEQNISLVKEKFEIYSSDPKTTEHPISGITEFLGLVDK